MNSELAWGSVGWVDDGGNYVEISQPGDDGNIYVRVTLFRGRDQSLATLDTNAQGTQVLCKLASSFIQVPPRGTRVLVASPHPFSRNGGSVIIAADNASPSLVGNIKAGDTNVAASQGVARLMMKGDGRVALATKDTNKIAGNDVFTQVSPTEERFWSPWGSRLHDATGFHLRTWHGAKFDMGGFSLPAPFPSVGSTAMLSVDMMNLDVAILSLGRDIGFTQAVVQAQPLQVTMTLVATALTNIAASLATLGQPAAGVAVAVAALALIGNPASTPGGTATNTTVA